MKHFLFVVLLVISTISVRANDGVYFTSGNMLVPVQETSISVTKEILTITVGKDSMAMIDVYYEFFNPDSTKIVTMAFEADGPYNTPLDETRSTNHPYIYDFTVKINNKTLPYRNSLIKRENAMSDAYGYYFQAEFLPGKNIVHHTYNYMMSYTIASKYEIHYWLTPAMRWANHKIDDFTLRIKKEHYMDYTIKDSLFASSTFQFCNGQGQIYPFTTPFGEHCILASCGNSAVLEWHAKDFVPSADLTITSIDRYIPTSCPYLWTTRAQVVINAEGMASRFIGESGDQYLVEAQDYALIPKTGAKLMEYSAENGQGCLVIRNENGSGVNVRMRATTESPVIYTIRNISGELPSVYPCLGVVKHFNAKKKYTEDWFKIKIDGRIGYIRSDLMIWDSINTY